MSTDTSKSVHILLQNERGQLLLCTRTKTKATYPGLITSSAGGRVESGESYLTAAKRELYEELGIFDIPLIHYGAFIVQNKHEHTPHQLFVGVISSSTPLIIDSQEIALSNWYSITDIREQILHSPDFFADPFLQAFVVYEKSLLYIIDFDHTLFNWYQCKEELQSYLLNQYKIDPSLFKKTKDLIEIDSLYNVFSHLDLLAIKTGIDRTKLLKAFSLFMDKAERFVYSDATSLLKRLVESPHQIVLLTYGDETNQEYFIEKTGIKKYLNTVKIVTEKTTKLEVLKKLGSQNNTIVSINDDPEEAIFTGELLPFLYNNIVVERANAKFTSIQQNSKYYKVLSLNDIVVPM